MTRPSYARERRRDRALLGGFTCANCRSHGLYGAALATQLADIGCSVDVKELRLTSHNQILSAGPTRAHLTESAGHLLRRRIAPAYFDLWRVGLREPACLAT